MTVEFHCADGVATITLNRPERLNALSFALLEDLGRVAARASQPDVRAVVVTGAGERAFCAGADIDELRGRSLVDQRASAAVGQGVFEALSRLPAPSFAALNGYAFGGGLELALACTFRIAAPRARLGLPEIKLGLIPGYGGTQRLPRLVGEARALDLILTGRTVTADEALAMGLVDRLAEDPVAAACAMAAEITGFSRPVVALARDAVSRGLSLPLAEGLRLEADLSTLAFQTADAEEGLAAFVERRKPDFRDA